MLDLSNPYIIAIIIAFVATAIFHFDQKQKKVEVQSISYVKVFSLVLVAIVGFNYFTGTKSNVLETITESVSKVEPIVTSSVTSSVSNGFPFANLKIKEGPPDF